MVETATPSSTPATTMRWREPGGFTVEISRRLDRVMVRLSGELDIATAPLLGELFTTAGSGSAVQVTLDVSGLGFIDVAGLTTILRERSAVRSRSGDLAFSAPSPCVRRLLELTDKSDLVTAHGAAGGVAPVNGRSGNRTRKLG
jgi:anti-sigma B factor antagonist